MTVSACRRPGVSPDHRILFLKDLAQRLSVIDEIVVQLERTPEHAAEAVGRIVRQAHDIKGTGAAFGVPAATDAARALEQYLLTLGDAGAVDLDRLRDHLDHLRALVGGDDGLE